jgi:predicted transcriptional regulator
MKKSDLEHVLIVDKTGEIVFESRILDKKTILVSGIFYIDNLKLTITQNYIILPTQKWIMHDKVDANKKDINITNEGIRVSSR